MRCTKTVTITLESEIALCEHGDMSTKTTAKRVLQCFEPKEHPHPHEAWIKFDSGEWGAVTWPKSPQENIA